MFPRTAFAIVMVLGAMLGASAGLGRSAAAPPPPDLFTTPRRTAVAANAARKRAIDVRVRVAGINPAALAALKPEIGAEVALNLFPNLRVTGVTERVTKETLDSQSWTGRLKDVPGTFALTRYQNSLFIDVLIAGKNVFEIRPAPGGYVIREIDPKRLPECGLQTGPGRVPAASADTPVTTERVVMTVVALYTPAAKAGAGSQANIEGHLIQSIALTNQCYANSQINAEVRLAYKGQIEYTESGTAKTDLERLTKKADGYLDAAHVLRDADKGDLVSLTEETLEPNIAGIANLMKSLSPSFEALAFSVVLRTAANSNLSFPHELGHNMGCGHDTTTVGLYPYSIGHHFKVGMQEYRTVMAYPPGTRIPYFSNPGVNYQGVPTGLTDIADNARTINQTCKTVGAFR